MKKAKILLAMLLTLLFALCAMGSGSDSSSSGSDSGNSGDGANATVSEVSTQPAATPISNGSQISDDYKDITINSVTLSYDVEPDNADGYYSHYPAENGKVYVVLDADVYNKAKAAMECDKVAKITVDYNNGYTYTGFSIVEEDNGSDFTYSNITSIDPLESCGMKWLVECPEEVETSGNPLKVILTVDGQDYVYTVR